MSKCISSVCKPFLQGAIFVVVLLHKIHWLRTRTAVEHRIIMKSYARVHGHNCSKIAWFFNQPKFQRVLYYHIRAFPCICSCAPKPRHVRTHNGSPLWTFVLLASRRLPLVLGRLPLKRLAVPIGSRSWTSFWYHARKVWRFHPIDIHTRCRVRWYGIVFWIIIWLTNVAFCCRAAGFCTSVFCKQLYLLCMCGRVIAMLRGSYPCRCLRWTR